MSRNWHILFAGIKGYDAENTNLTYMKNSELFSMGV